MARQLKNLRTQFRGRRFFSTSKETSMAVALLPFPHPIQWIKGFQVRHPRCVV